MEVPETQITENAKKHNFPSFYPKVTFLLQKCILELFLAFWAIFTLLAPNGPKKHQETITPTSFWAVGSHNYDLATKCIFAKFRQKTHFIKSHQTPLFCGISEFWYIEGPNAPNTQKPCRLLVFQDPKRKKMWFCSKLRKSCWESKWTPSARSWIQVSTSTRVRRWYTRENFTKFWIATVSPPRSRAEIVFWKLTWVCSRTAG